MPNVYPESIPGSESYDRMPYDMPVDPDRELFDFRDALSLDAVNRRLIADSGRFDDPQERHLTPDARAARVMHDTEERIAVEGLFTLAAHLASERLAATAEAAASAPEPQSRPRVMPSDEIIKEIDAIFIDKPDRTDDPHLTPDARAALHVAGVEAKVQSNIQKSVVIKAAGGLVGKIGARVNDRRGGFDKLKAKRNEQIGRPLEEPRRTARNASRPVRYSNLTRRRDSPEA